MLEFQLKSLGNRFFQYLDIIFFTKFIVTSQNQRDLENSGCVIVWCFCDITSFCGFCV